jgi:hypothetical protein
MALTQTAKLGTIKLEEVRLNGQITYKKNILTVPHRMNNTPSTYKQQSLKQCMS